MLLIIELIYRPKKFYYRRFLKVSMHYYSYFFLFVYQLWNNFGIIAHRSIKYLQLKTN